MSQRREKRFRLLERRVLALETICASRIITIDMEAQPQKIIADENASPTPHLRGKFWARLSSFFRRRAGR